MTVDARANLAISSVATAPSPATSGTSLVVASGEGARFPAAPFNATIWPAGATPTPANAEIVRVTTVSTDTLTIARAQEGTTARSVVVSDQIAAAITKKMIDDLTIAASVATYADRKVRTAGNITLNSTSWIDVDNALDIALSAKTGDWIEAGISATWNNDSVYGRLDVVSLVSAAPVNSWAQDAAPNNAYGGYHGLLGVSGLFIGGTCSMYRKLVSGDIASGSVTLRVRGRTDTASNKTLNAGTNFPLVFWARNHG